MSNIDPQNSLATEIESAWNLRESDPTTALETVRLLQVRIPPGSLEDARVLIVEAACLWRKFNFTDMMARLVTAFEILKNENDYLWLARLQGRISVGLTSAGDMAGAYKHLHLQLAAASAASNSAQQHEELFTVFHNMGRHFFVREDYKRADQCYQRCYQYLQAHDITNVLLKQNHAETIARLGNLSLAVTKLDEAMALAKQHPPNRSVVYALGVKSWILIEQRHFRQAEETLLYAIEYATDNDIPDAQLRMKLATLHLQQQQYSKALKDLRPVEEIIRKRGDKHDRANYHKFMSQVLEARKNYKASLAHFKIYHQEQQDINSSKASSRAQAENLIDRLEDIRRKSTQLERENLALKDTVNRYKSLHEEARELSERDPLTGLYNRRALEEIADNIIELTASNESTVVVAVIDLDHFKRINDTYGHHVGDQVLVQFTKLIIATFRSADCISRYGGEEFVLVLPHTSEANARDALYRLRMSVSQHDWVFSENRLSVTFSAGISSSSEHETFESLFRKADSALYVAKAMGRDRICVSGGAIDLSDNVIVPDIDLANLDKAIT